MEEFGVLEQKIVALVDVAKKLKAENASLIAANELLRERAEAAEKAVLRDREQLNQEAEVTKMVVDDLIKSIDMLVLHESVQ